MTETRVAFTVKADREGGKPMEMELEKLDHSGFIGKIEGDTSKFIAPCVFYVPDRFSMDRTNGSASPAETKKVVYRSVLVQIKFINYSYSFPFVILSLPFMSTVDDVSGGATKDASGFYLYSSLSRLQQNDMGLSEKFWSLD